MKFQWEIPFTISSYEIELIFASLLIPLFRNSRQLVHGQLSKLIFLKQIQRFLEKGSIIFFWLPVYKMILAAYSISNMVNSSKFIRENSNKYGWVSINKLLWCPFIYLPFIGFQWNKYGASHRAIILLKAILTLWFLVWFDNHIIAAMILYSVIIYILGTCQVTNS